MNQNKVTYVDTTENVRTDRQIRFIQEYCVDFNATQAAIRAGYSERTAQEQSSRLLSNVIVRSAIDRRMAAVAALAEVDAAMVVRELYEVATADPRDLMRIDIDCCRHCRGIDHKYHWTEPEYRRALDAAMSAGKSAPDLEGGFGFRPDREPHPDCPNCFGRGEERVTVTASNKLSKAAAKLIAGVKQSRDGIEIKTRDQDAALVALGRVVGVFRDRQEVTGAGGGPVALTAVPALNTLTNSELETLLRSNGRQLPLKGTTI